MDGRALGCVPSLLTKDIASDIASVGIHQSQGFTEPQEIRSISIRESPIGGYAPCRRVPVEIAVKGGEQAQLYPPTGEDFPRRSPLCHWPQSLLLKK